MPVSTSANLAARPSNGLSGHAQHEIQAENERLLANARRSVLEVFATRMSESQSDCFFSMLEHAIVPVHATKFAEVETGLQATNIFLRALKDLIRRSRGTKC